MSLLLDLGLKGKGTKFRLFPQNPFLTYWQKPETIWVSVPAGHVGPGPSDERMYVIEPARTKSPYEFPYLPPYRGNVLPAVKPNSAGHFDYLEADTLEFQAAHIYGTLRRVLDIWEDYFREKIAWHFWPDYKRLEIIPWLDWDNAQAGYGFIEAGYGLNREGEKEPFSLNFDVLAHEFGHLILFSKVGIPTEQTLTADYLGFQESAADLTSIVSVLHFDSFVDHLLSTCRGNLYALNELNRIGELSETEQIRLASNTLRMSDVVDSATPPQNLSQPDRHKLGEPLTGAIFDIFVEVFELLLVERGLISGNLDAQSREITDNEQDAAEVQARFDRAYHGKHELFKSALLEARDYMGYCLATTWRRLSADYLSFTEVGSTLLAVDQKLTGGKYRDGIIDCLRWREIGFIDGR